MKKKPVCRPKDKRPVIAVRMNPDLYREVKREAKKLQMTVSYFAACLICTGYHIIGNRPSLFKPLTGIELKLLPRKASHRTYAVRSPTAIKDN